MSPFQCVVQGVNILSTFKQVKPPKIQRIREKFIDRPKPWAYFDGASQEEPPLGGACGIICIFDSHNYSFKVGVGLVSNNLVEMWALKFTLTLTVEYGLTCIRIFGDSLLVIYWFNKEYT